MADQLCGGDLAARLARLRGQGLSYEQVARSLSREAGVEASSNTVRSWIRQLGIEGEAA